MNDGNHTSTSDPNEKAERRERLRQAIDSTKAPSMVDTLISLLLEAKEIIATHRARFPFWRKRTSDCAKNWRPCNRPC